MSLHSIVHMFRFTNLVNSIECIGLCFYSTPNSMHFVYFNDTRAIFSKLWVKQNEELKWDYPWIVGIKNSKLDAKWRIGTTHRSLQATINKTMHKLHLLQFNGGNARNVCKINSINLYICVFMNVCAVCSVYILISNECGAIRLFTKAIGHWIIFQWVVGSFGCQVFVAVCAHAIYVWVSVRVSMNVNVYV